MYQSYAEQYAFVERYERCVVKPIAYDGYTEFGAGYALHTNYVTLNDVDVWRDAICLSPVFVQRAIRKHRELRITIIGEHTFCCVIDSQGHPDTRVWADWRLADPRQLPHSIIPIDDVLEQQLRAMLAHYGLNFGAFDVIEENGIPVFLELNPNGQYLWIEKLTGARLTSAMVSLVRELAAGSSG